MDSDRIQRLEYEIARLTRQIANLPVRIALGSGGGGGDSTSIRRALLQTTAIFPGRTGATPGTIAGYTPILGDSVGAVKNYSTVDIPSGVYVISMQIGEEDVMINAFC